MEADPQKRFEGMSQQDILDSVDRAQEERRRGVVVRFRGIIGDDGGPDDSGSLNREPRPIFPNSGAGAVELPAPSDAA